MGFRLCPLSGAYREARVLISARKVGATTQARSGVARGWKFQVEVATELPSNSPQRPTCDLRGKVPGVPSASVGPIERLRNFLRCGVPKTCLQRGAA